MALEFVLKLNDYMTPKLGAAAKAADSAVGRMNQKASAQARSMGMSMDAARKKVEDLRMAANKETDWRMLKTGLREAAKLERQLDKVRDKAEGKRGGGVGMLGGALKPLLAAASIGAVMSFATTSVKAAMDFGATSKSYEVLAGNATKGRALANNLNKLQQDTILGPEVFKAGQTLMSFGMSVDKVMPVMKQLGDVSMGNSQRFEALTLAFAQTQSAGKLMGQDLLQYVNAGFNPLQTMSEKWKEFGFKSQMSVGQLRKAMEKGSITSAMVAKSFEIATNKGGKFADMMDTIATTSFGKMKILEGQYENFKIQIGNALMPLAEGLMGFGTKALDWLNISTSGSQTLLGEKAEINSLVQTITQLNEQNSLRGRLVNNLVAKYPDYFSGIDKETALNSQLLLKLNEINDAYDRRIGISNKLEKADIYKKLAEENYGDYKRAIQTKELIQSGNLEMAAKLNGSLIPAMGKHLLPKYLPVWDQLADKSLKAYDINMAKSKANENQGKMLGLGERFRGYYDTANNDKELKNKIPDAKKRATFIALSKQIGFKNGGVQTPGGFAFADKFEQLLKPKGNTSETDVANMKASAEKAMSGQKTITINIQRLGGMDNAKLQFASVNEGLDDIEKKEKVMFLRVVNAAIGLGDN